MKDTRIGKNLANLTDAKVGEELYFFYHGHGNHSNNWRNVRVTGVYDTYILGNDLDHPDESLCKEFKDCEAGNIQVIKATDAITFEQAKRDLKADGTATYCVLDVLSIEQLCTVYNEAFEINYEVSEGYLVKQTQEPKWGCFDCFISVDGSPEYVDVDIVLPSGRRLDLEINFYEQQVRLEGKAVTPKELVNCLAAWLDND